MKPAYIIMTDSVSVSLLVLLYFWLTLCIIFTAIVLWTIFRFWHSAAKTLKRVGESLDNVGETINNCSDSMDAVTSLWAYSVETLTDRLENLVERSATLRDTIDK